jgi:ubiquinone/menaquinone biosynthesis C-methylase UbiE
MGIGKTLSSQFSNPHGRAGWVAALIMPPLTDRHCGDLARVLDLRPEDDLLDVACGAGVFVHRHGTPVRRIAGIDQSEIQVRLARWRNSGRIAAGSAEFVQGDGAALPWEDESFSAVTCNYVGCFSEPERSLREMYRVLRPQGRVALEIDYCSDEVTARRQQLKWGLPSWTEAEFRQLMDEAGFSGVSTWHVKGNVLARAVRP